jgi:hypothetical protein
VGNDNDRKQLIESLRTELRNLESYRAFLAMEAYAEKEKRKSWIRVERNAKIALVIALLFAAPLLAFELPKKCQGELVSEDTQYWPLVDIQIRAIARGA